MLKLPRLLLGEIILRLPKSSDVLNLRLACRHLNTIITHQCNIYWFRKVVQFHYLYRYRKSDNSEYIVFEHNPYYNFKSVDDTPLGPSIPYINCLIPEECPDGVDPDLHESYILALKIGAGILDRVNTDATQPQYAHLYEEWMEECRETYPVQNLPNNQFLLAFGRMKFLQHLFGKFVCKRKQCQTIQPFARDLMLNNAHAQKNIDDLHPLFWPKYDPSVNFLHVFLLDCWKPRIFEEYFDRPIEEIHIVQKEHEANGKMLKRFL